MKGREKQMAKNACIVSSGWQEILNDYNAGHLSDERRKARVHGEGVARGMLEDERKLGKFSKDDIRAFLKALNADYYNDKEHHSRFMPAFYGHLANQIVDSDEAFNHWAEKIWNADDKELEVVLDEFWKSNEVAGAGTSLPTAILYIRDPKAYAVWIPAMESGLKAVLPSLKLKRRRTAAGYHIYNKAVQAVRSQLDLIPLSMDIVLTLAQEKTSSKIVDENSFETLFNEFVGSFVDLKEGQAHLLRYTSERQEAEKNFRNRSQLRNNSP